MPRKSASTKKQAPRGEQASADVTMLVLTVATLAPVVQSMTAFVEAAGRREHAIADNQAAEMADLAALAATVDKLLKPTPRRPAETAPNTPSTAPLAVA